MINQNIIRIAQSRNIEYLVHFTRLSNLSSIMKNGIMPNSVQIGKNIVSHRNDHQRLDYTDAVCLSVSFPNYKLFYRFREKYEKEQWVVLLLSPEILGTHHCAFAYKNAASSTISSRTKETMMNEDAFMKMFAEPSDWRTREKMQTAPYETTDPQAEILVFDTIAPHYIKGIIAQSNINESLIKSVVPVRYHKKVYSEFEKYYYSSTRCRMVSYFDSRPDYRYWRY